MGKKGRVRHLLQYGKKIVLIGTSFSEETRTIKDWKVDRGCLKTWSLFRHPHFKLQESSKRSIIIP